MIKFYFLEKTEIKKGCLSFVKSSMSRLATPFYLKFLFYNNNVSNKKKHIKCTFIVYVFKVNKSLYTEKIL